MRLDNIAITVFLILLFLGAIAFGVDNSRMIAVCSDAGMHYVGGAFVKGDHQSYNGSSRSIRCEDDSGQIHWIKEVRS